MHHPWAPGDWAVYRKSKVSTSPGPRATNVVASQKGDSYTYIVDKFWIVEELLPAGELRMRTARGKTHVIRQDDPCLRRPSLIQRMMWRNRFRHVEQTKESSPDVGGESAGAEGNSAGA
jgi:hypothetical protein